MNKNEINWERGNVTFWDLDNFDLDKSLHSQVLQLKEDLVQVEFRNGVVLDLGWNPEFNLTGQFVLTVVKFKNEKNPTGEDWDSPILQIKFRDTAQFMMNLSRAVQAANRVASE